MSNQAKQWGAIIVMIALFAMIAFVTNLCNPMANIIKEQGEISNVLAQIGNYGNFGAYLLMGLPAGMLISKFGFKKTALIGLLVGIVGVLVQWCSGLFDPKIDGVGTIFAVYLTGALISGCCMAILNCVVNPMLNLLGGGGNGGNKLIQIGGVFNSSAAVACYILMGALIGDIAKRKAEGNPVTMSDATPALMIALTIFVIAFIVICFTKIEEPKQAPVQLSLVPKALSHRHFALGALAIFLYMGVEVGVPNFVDKYLVNEFVDPETGKNLSSEISGLLVAVYWASIGNKVSARAMVTTVSIATLVLVGFGMFAPTDILVPFPGVKWSTMELIMQDVPVGIFAMLLVGLCTSVMWGAIFNMAVEGLGELTSIASGIFMAMVCGGAVLQWAQAYIADSLGYMTSFWVVMGCAAYILFYAQIGSRVSKKA